MPQGHTTENPTNYTLKASLDSYRQGVEALVLDEAVPVYDRLQALFATQQGNWAAYRSVGAIDLLQKAEGKPILVKGVGQLAIGQLDVNNPWEIVDLSDSPPDISSEIPKALGLTANFAEVRLISSDASYWHTSYNQTSRREAIGPVVTTPDSNQIILDLGEGPAESEHFAWRLDQAKTAISIGIPAIHERFQREAAQGTDKRIATALHAATSMALAELSQASSRVPV